MMINIIPYFARLLLAIGFIILVVGWSKVCYWEGVKDGADKSYRLWVRAFRKLFPYDKDSLKGIKDLIHEDVISGRDN